MRNWMLYGYKIYFTFYDYVTNQQAWNFRNRSTFSNEFGHI